MANPAEEIKIEKKKRIEISKMAADVQCFGSKPPVFLLEIGGFTSIIDSDNLDNGIHDSSRQSCQAEKTNNKETFLHINS